MPQICTAQVFTTVGLPELAGEASYLLGAECIVYPGSLLLLGYLQSCFSRSRSPPRALARS